MGRQIMPVLENPPLEKGGGGIFEIFLDKISPDPSLPKRGRLRGLYCKMTNISALLDYVQIMA